MIQENREKVKTRELGDFDTEGFGIQEENLGMAYEAFMQYSNPIASIVREITSNAWDATVEAGKKDPVIVEMSQKYPPDDDRWIAFHDSGTGLIPLPNHTPDGRKITKKLKEGSMSEKKAHEYLGIIKDKIIESGKPSMLVYKNFFSSTKRREIDQIGFFGLGAKSPLGYTDMFEVITRRSGYKYHYVVRKGEDKPELSLLSHEETDRGNGTTVRVPIHSRSDWRQFTEEIQTQLCYFDNVIFEGGLDGKIDNDFEIYRGDHFIYRPDSEFDKMHLCLGKVYYPLDFDVMGIREGYKKYGSDKRTGHSVPIGLYFPLEDQKELPLNVVWNRESIEYNDKTKESIEKKLKLAKEELQELYDKQFENINSVEDWYRLRKEKDQNRISISEDIKIPITDDIIDSKSVDIPKYGNYFEKTPNNPFYMIDFYRRVDGGYIEQKAKSVKLENAYANPENYDPIFLTEEGFSTKKNKWISTELKPEGSDSFIILKIVDISSDLNDPHERERIESRFKSKFMEGRYSSGDPSEKDLKAMLAFEKKAIKHFKDVFRNYDDISPSDSFDPKSKGKKRNQNSYVNYDPEEKFPLKQANTKSDSYGWRRVRWSYDSMRDLDQKGKLIIYGARDDDENLKTVMKLLHNIGKFSGGYHQHLDYDKVHVVKIAKNRFDMFSELRGSYHVDNFLESDHPIFRRLVTAFDIYDDIPNHDLVSNWKGHLQEGYDLYRSIKNLVGPYHFSTSKYDTWIDDILEDKKHLIDPEVRRDLERVKGYIIKYPLISWLERTTPTLGSLRRNLDLEGELEKYIEDRPPIDPHLLFRYTQYKNQQEDNE